MVDDEQQPWLAALGSHLTTAEQGEPTTEVTQLPADVADYRHRWRITHPDPLGIATVDPGQAAERTLLSLALDQTDHLGAPGRVVEVNELDDNRFASVSLDDGPGW